jgi:hypothetical protein
MMSEFLSQEENTLMIMIAMFLLMLAVFYNLLLTNFSQKILMSKITIATIIAMKFGQNLSDLNF